MEREKKTIDQRRKSVKVKLSLSLIPRVLFFTLLIIFFAALFLIYESKFRVLKPQFVQGQLAKNNVYEKVVNNSEFLAEEFIRKQFENGRENGEGPLKEGDPLPIDPLEAAGFIKRNIDPTWLKGQFESLSNQIFAFVLSDKQRVEFKIDISGLRSNFATEVESFARSQFAKLPEVSEQEFQKMMEKENFPKARPRGASFEEVMGRLPENPVDIILGRIPLSLSATTDQLKDNPKANEFLSNVERFRFAKKISDIVFYTLFLVILCFVFLFAKLSSHTLRGFLLYVGIYLLPGFILSLIFLTLRYMDAFFINTFLVPRIQNVLPVLRDEIFLPVLKSSYRDILGDLMLWSFMLGLIGLLLTLFLRFINGSDKNLLS